MADATAPVTGDPTRHDVTAPDHAPGEDEPRFLPGDRVGRYVLLSSVGKGGMSVVYLAYDPELDRKVALKLMRVTMLGEKGKLRLQREAQALAKLSHPNVVPVYDAGTVGDQAFVAMEFVEGKTLRRWLKDEHSWKERLAVMLDAGRGLAAAHAAGLVHRDFKPDNVLIGDDGRVRVLDFGLARLASVIDGREPSSTPSLDDPPSVPPSEGGVAMIPSSSPSMIEVTRADQLIGTPAYMAPEQMRREGVDERADQFSFAVTLFEALYGKRPFEVNAEAIESAASTASLMSMQVARTRVRVPRGSPVPKWAGRVIARALDDDPAARWPRMDDLLRELTRDPLQKWRRAAVGVALGLALASAALLVERAQSRTRALCHGGEARAASVWGPEARDEVARAFAKTGVPYADTATRTITRALDGYARDWAAMDDDACAATRIRGDQSDDVLDLRAACLSDRMKELGALVDAVRHADVETVQQASRATQSLIPLSDCADIAALRAPTPRPHDPATAARIEDLQQRLAVVQATYAVGKATQAAKLGDELRVDATPPKGPGYAPLLAQIEFWRGRSFADLGESERSIPAFREAFTTALASRSDRVLREAAVRLSQEYIYANQPTDFATWAQVADAAIARTGPDAHIEEFLAHVRCVAMWTSGALQSRLACLEKHAAKVEHARPLNDWELVTIGLAASDAGEYERGVKYLRQGFQYSAAENGPTHPRTLEMRAYLCKGLLDYGDLDGAMRECEEARKMAETVAADNPALLGKIGLYMGSALRQMYRYDEARAQIEKARDHVQPDEVLGELAAIESATGREQEALAYYKGSLDEAEKSLPPAHSNVLGAQLELGAAELETGAVAEARRLFERALSVTEHAEINPIMLASLRFAEARALWRSTPRDGVNAVARAEDARAGYLAHAPATKRYQDDLRHIEQWLAQPDVRAQAWPTSSGAREPW